MEGNKDSIAAAAPARRRGINAFVPQGFRPLSRCMSAKAVQAFRTYLAALRVSGAVLTFGDQFRMNEYERPKGECFLNPA
jgi:hypothetical protein